MKIAISQWGSHHRKNDVAWEFEDGVQDGNWQIEGGSRFYGT